MKIKIVTSHPVLKNISGKFTADELKFIKILEEDEELEPFLKKARLASGIPKCGFDMSKPINASEYKDVWGKLNLNELAKQTIYFMQTYWHYHLPRYWMFFFENLALFNFALPMDKTSYPPIETKDDPEGGVDIIIRENVSIRELKVYITSHSDLLNQKLGALPKSPKVKISEEKLSIMKRVIELKKEGKTDKAIAEILDKEYGSDLPFSPDYEIVAVERNRFEKYLDRTLSISERKEFKRVINEAITLNKNRTNPNLFNNTS